MPISVFPAGLFRARPRFRRIALVLGAFGAAATAHAEDVGKKLCLPDAKRLCSAEMHSLSRAKVRACLIAHLQDTSPPCHDFMVAQRKAALSGHAPDPSAQ